MCGISGIVAKVNGLKLAKEIHQMNDLIIHRGPDAEGYYTNEKMAFGHRRLSILDLSENGNQPMKLDNLVIVFNGEIYNYIELRKELTSFGCCFKTKTDTEVILHAYKIWGKNCVKKFNGMWSFAIYDKEKEIIFCSRDRFGVKPFYYADCEKRFLFGSEIKQIVHFFENCKADKETLSDFLVCGLSEHTNKTFFKNIYNLQGGHNLIYDLKSHKFSIYSYYNINIVKDDLFETESKKDYYSKFKKAVELRLRSDVKVGTCLSGGLDSSSIASVASDLYYSNSNQKFIGIHAQSSEKKSDESKYAKKLSETKFIDLIIVSPSISDFEKYIDEVCYAQEEPFSGPSVFMQYFVMKKAKDIGCKVMLDGQGGDETLLGYERYFPLLIFEKPFQKAIKTLYFACINSKLTFGKLLAYCFYFILFPLRIIRQKIQFRFIKDEYLPNFVWVKKNAKAYLNMKSLQKLEITNTQLPHLLRYEDKNSMRNSVETRLPFLDYKLLEKSIKTDYSFKLKDGWTKYILRKSMEGIMPNEVIWRKNKFGFEAPKNSWLNSIRQTMINTVKNNSLLKKICKKDTSFEQFDNDIIWKLFSIAKWSELYKVNDII